jgi:hypothetical protein
MWHNFRPDVAKKLARSPCYALRFLASRIENSAHL